jgi:hypothetical protein
MRRAWAWPYLRWLLLAAVVVEVVAVILVLVGKAESVVSLTQRRGRRAAQPRQHRNSQPGAGG